MFSDWLDSDWLSDWISDEWPGSWLDDSHGSWLGSGCVGIYEWLDKDWLGSREWLGGWEWLVTWWWLDGWNVGGWLLRDCAWRKVPSSEGVVADEVINAGNSFTDCTTRSHVDVRRLQHTMSNCCRASAAILLEKRSLVQRV